MGDYTKLQFEFLTVEQKEILIALLSESNYEGFEEQGDLLAAYIRSEFFDPVKLKRIVSHFNSSFSISQIKDENWNEVWESSFQPVIIDSSHGSSWVGIRAGFHKPLNDVEHEIIITPKMSFGTGHHATTSMMISMMSDVDFSDKSVLDFGTGTGVLAILSEKLGARRIIAIDNDDQSIENATENFNTNACSRIEPKRASDALGDDRYDIILANIIKSVILDNMSAFVKQLIPRGVILLSGLLEEDESAVAACASRNGLFVEKKIAREGWICLKLTQ